MVDAVGVTTIYPEPDQIWLEIMQAVRETRRYLLYNQRQIFDEALRPMLLGAVRIAYPEAIYLINVDDYYRACRAVSVQPQVLPEIIP